MKTAYKNCYILDGSEQMQPQSGLAVLVDGEKIAAIVPETAIPAGYAEVDLGGGYLMPGLINLHIHLPGSGKPKKKQADTKKLVRLLTSNALLRQIIVIICKGAAKTQLMSGVTTVRTVGGVEAYDAMIRDMIADGKAVGPRILAGNMAVSVPGGHMAGSLAYEAHTPEEAASYVRDIADSGADLIKLMITGGVLDATAKGEPGALRMRPELVKACCEEAHARGLQVAAHVESPEGVRVALRNGVDTIEHGAKPDAEILELFRKRNAALVATLSPALPYALFDPAISHVSEMEQFNGKVVFDGIVESAKACLAAGIPVGLGTDTGCPYITHYDMWRELNYFRKFCGVSNAFALYTATKRNAEIVGIDSVTGTIEPGKCADMIVCARNPLDDLSVLWELQAVIARGKRYDAPRVKKMANVERELDKFL